MGGGAVFFHVAQVYHVNQFFISDINQELILVYRTIQEDVESLINLLAEIEAQYLQLSADEQKKLFYKIRSEFNNHDSIMNLSKVQMNWVERAAQIIFLNWTCFNGLFRVNAKSKFNVPFGRYKKPTICFKENLREISKILQKAEICQGDFRVCSDFVDAETFVYFDPPYRPISKTANFTSYSKFDFDDEAQLSLAAFFRQLDQKGAKLMLSNSAPENINPDDHFFEDAYKGYRIERVQASRMINCETQKRGKINELLIMNY